MAYLGKDIVLVNPSVAAAECFMYSESIVIYAGLWRLEQSIIFGSP